MFTFVYHLFNCIGNCHPIYCSHSKEFYITYLSIILYHFILTVISLHVYANIRWNVLFRHYLSNFIEILYFYSFFVFFLVFFVVDVAIKYIYMIILNVIHFEL